MNSGVMGIGNSESLQIDDKFPSEVSGILAQRVAGLLAEELYRGELEGRSEEVL